MTGAQSVVLIPFVLFLLGGVLCLLLEAAGTPIGASKRGPRSHLALTGVFCFVSAAIQLVVSARSVPLGQELWGGALRLDALAIFGAALCTCVGVQTLVAGVQTMRRLEEERGEVYALHLLTVAAFFSLVFAADLLVVAAAGLWARIGMGALAALERRTPQSAEATVKLIVSDGFFLTLLCFGAALIYGASGTTSFSGIGLAIQNNPQQGWAGLAMVVVPILGWLPAVPVHGVRVDANHGATSFVGGLGAASGALAGAVLLMRLAVDVGPVVGEVWAAPLESIVWLTWLVPALVALDQRRVSRMVAHLSVVQMGGALLLARLVGVAPELIANPALRYWLAATAVTTAAALPALTFFAGRIAEEDTWENWSGAGRAHPVITSAFLWLLAGMAGLPGTPGFAVRLDIAQLSFANGFDAMGVGIILTPVFAAVPVMRLAIFLFAKTPKQRKKPLWGRWDLAAFVMGLFLVASAGFWSSADFRDGREDKPERPMLRVDHRHGEGAGQPSLQGILATAQNTPRKSPSE